MRRYAIRDDQWDRIKDMLPGRAGHVGVTARDNRLFVDAVIYRYRAGIPWRDLPEHFGSWKTVWKRHRRYAADGTWDSVLATLLGQAESRGLVDWEVSVDSTINRAHQHGTNLPRHTGGPVELQESSRRAP
jgi:transposase